MLIDITIRSEDILRQMSDGERVELIRECLGLIACEGTIEDIRALVNDSTWDDQESTDAN